MTSNPQQPVITELSQLDPEKVYSYADYWLWRLKERVELIKGKIFEMSPAPAEPHQRVSQKLNWFLLNTFMGKGCSVYTAPFDVRLPLQQEQTDDKQLYTVVQPDLCVICDRSKIDKRGCIGAPDLVVEIFSPGNSKREMRDKYDVYEAAGVQEYWLVDYQQKVVLVYVQQQDKFVGLQPLTEDEVLVSQLFPELKIDLKEVFADVEPEEELL